MALKWIVLEYNRHPEIAFWLPNTGSSGQRLRRSRAGVIRQKWRNQEHSELDEMYTHGEYGGKQADPVLAEQRVTLIQSAIRGRNPDPDKPHLADPLVSIMMRQNPR